MSPTDSPDVEAERREGLKLRIPARYSPPKTKIGTVRCAARDKVKKHSSWVGGIDPMNIVIGCGVVAAPVIGASIILAFALVALVLVLVILW